jgi:hypothetical protein
VPCKYKFIKKLSANYKIYKIWVNILGLKKIKYKQVKCKPQEFSDQGSQKYNNKIYK